MSSFDVTKAHYSRARDCRVLSGSFIWHALILVTLSPKPSDVVWSGELLLEDQLPGGLQLISESPWDSSHTFLTSPFCARG